MIIQNHKHYATCLNILLAYAVDTKPFTPQAHLPQVSQHETEYRSIGSGVTFSSSPHGPRKISSLFMEAFFLDVRHTSRRFFRIAGGEINC